MNVAFGLGFPQIGHEATTRNRRVDLEHGREQRVLNAQARASAFPLRRLGNAAAEVTKQILTDCLFVRLRGVVGRPILPIGFAEIVPIRKYQSRFYVTTKPRLV